jgi:hypothetical protein
MTTILVLAPVCLLLDRNHLKALFNIEIPTTQADIEGKKTAHLFVFRHLVQTEAVSILFVFASDDLRECCVYISGDICLKLQEDITD